MSRPSLLWLQLKGSFIVVLPMTASTVILYITALFVTRRFWHVFSWSRGYISGQIRHEPRWQR